MRRYVVHSITDNEPSKTTKEIQTMPEEQLKRIHEILDPVCRVYGGECEWVEHYGQFVLKQNADTGRKLVLVFRGQNVFVSLYTSRENKQQIQQALRLFLPKGELNKNVSVEYAERRRGPTGIVIRFYFLNVIPQEFAARLDDVAANVRTVLETVKNTNALAIE